jgi:hypothetical protein
MMMIYYFALLVSRERERALFKRNRKLENFGVQEGIQASFKNRWVDSRGEIQAQAFKEGVDNHHFKRNQLPLCNWGDPSINNNFPVKSPPPSQYYSSSRKLKFQLLIECEKSH